MKPKRFVLFRVNLRRARRRAIERIFERDQDAVDKPTLSPMQVTEFRALLDLGKYDETSNFRRSIYAAHSAGLATETMLGGAATGHNGGASMVDRLSLHAAEQADHIAHMGSERALGAVHDALGAPEDPDEQMRGLRAGGGGDDAGGGGDDAGGGGDDGGGDDGGGGALDALDEVPGVDEAQEALAAGVDGVRDGAAAAADGVRDGVSQLQSWAQSAKGFITSAIETVSSAFSPGQMKILMGNLQINASFTVVFEIPWPSGFTTFLGCTFRLIAFFDTITLYYVNISFTYLSHTRTKL